MDIELIDIELKKQKKLKWYNLHQTAIAQNWNRIEIINTTTKNEVIIVV